MERLSDFAYDLPEDLIAQTPLEDRSSSRLLVLHRNGAIEHRRFVEAIDLLQPGDLLVMNDTRVSAVRLFGHKSSGGEVEALLLRRIGSALYEALLRPGKRLKSGSRIEFDDRLSATVQAEQVDGVRTILFDDVADLEARIKVKGLVPLPPYIHERLADAERYQTVYGVHSGSSAAPTAGLHFTSEILDRLIVKGVDTARVTLHVGIDTFRPVQVENLDEHQMHGETCIVSEEAAKKVREAKGRIIAVGTTTVRTLESFAMGQRLVQAGEMESKLFIRPGFKFQIVDGMFTNFHLPATTMLLMISALATKNSVLEAYRQAISEKYRFLSFGDSMLIL